MSITGLNPLTDIFVNYVDDLSSGRAQLLTGYGYRSSIGTDATGNDVWPGTAILIPWPSSSGEQMQLYSSSVQDTMTTGTGAWQVSIHYLDADGIPSVETINLNGTNTVTTVATDIRWVQELHVESAGTGLLAAGTIKIHKSGDVNTVYNRIEVGTNQSLHTARMVPAGKVCLLWTFNSSAGGGKPCDMRIRATAHEGISTTNLFHFIDNRQLLDSGGERTYRTPRIIPAFSVIKCTSYAPAGSGGANVQASWEGILLDVPAT